MMAEKLLKKFLLIFENRKGLGDIVVIHQEEQLLLENLAGLNTIFLQKVLPKKVVQTGQLIKQSTFVAKKFFLPK